MGGEVCSVESAADSRTKFRAFAAAFLLALASTGCSPKVDSAKPAAPKTGPDTPIVDLQSMLGPKAGYWQAVVSESGKPAQTSRFCSAGKPLWTQFVDATGCFTYAFKRSAAGDIIADGTCTNSDGITTSERFVFHGDLDRAYTVDQTETSNAPGPARTVHEDHSYLGVCPPGVTPSA